MLNLENRKVTIVGAQKSGIALSRLIAQLKGIPKVTDQREAEKFDSSLLEDLQKQGVVLEFGGHTRAFVEDSDLLVLSPGVRFDSSCVQWAREKNILVLGEIEFACQWCDKPIICVTGSNGKTTVVHLIRDVINASGKRACLCGNVGTPFSDYVLDLDSFDYIVLEVSSFQMESLLARDSSHPEVKRFQPHIAVLLNFNENHLDRHKDLEEYFEAKVKMFSNQTEQDFAVLNYANDRIRALEKRLGAQVRFFNDPDNQYRHIENQNHRAVSEVADILGVSLVCKRVFDTFQGVEHRMEKVRILDAVEYINDSKSTTAEALRWALKQISKPIYLICGGKDKNIDFSVLKELVGQKVKKIFAIGEASDKVLKTFESVVSVETCQSLEHAVLSAKKSASSGSCILLSPMCASFDMFDNFEHRGKVFKEIVNSLT